ncbi:MAG: c-type cytochrome [Halioglobus sp.]|nr:c-type cytochrome [Halioglobus sp.]
MMYFFRLVTAATLLAGLAACQGGAVSGQQFVLPEGDAARGEAAFVELECTACHTVRGKGLPAAAEKGPVTIMLGGNVSKVKSYNELVTSVINPSHKLARNLFKQKIEQDGQSIMPVYNDVMTVSQMVDIVAFLESQYEVVKRPVYRYPVFKY